MVRPRAEWDSQRIVRSGARTGSYRNSGGAWHDRYERATDQSTTSDGARPSPGKCPSPRQGGCGLWRNVDDEQHDHLFAVARLVARLGSGGTPAAIATPELEAGELKYLLPHMLPGDQTVIFTVTHTLLPTWEDTEIIAQSLVTGARKVLVKQGADGRYLSSGHLVFVRRGTVMAVRFDLERLEVTGGAVALIGDVLQAANASSEQFDTGAAQFSVSSSESLLYLAGGVVRGVQIRERREREHHDAAGRRQRSSRRLTTSPNLQYRGRMVAG